MVKMPGASIAQESKPGGAARPGIQPCVWNSTCSCLPHCPVASSRPLLHFASTTSMSLLQGLRTHCSFARKIPPGIYLTHLRGAFKSSLRCRPLVGLPGQPVLRRIPARPSLSVCSLLLWRFLRRLNRLPVCCGFHSFMFVVCVSPVFGRLGSEPTPVLAHGRCSVNVAECTTKNTAAS